MGDDLLSGIAAAPLAWLAGAFVFGLATGWLLWGGRRSAEAGGEPGDGAAPAIALSQIDARDGDGLDALEREIRAARARLAESDDEAGKMAQELDSLDKAIKRANGRLKLLLRAVQRATGDKS